MAGVTDIRDMAHKLYVNMHDPFSSFGPVNLVDLGLVDRRYGTQVSRSMMITGPKGVSPTNLSGGLLARGHPLGATGMVQVAEDHRMLLETPQYQMALAQSIGGPINNNVVTLLEKADHYESRQDHHPFKPTGLPKLAAPKPKGLSLETLLVEHQRVKARFHCATTRFNKDGEPLNSIVLLAPVLAANAMSSLSALVGEYERIQHMRPEAGNPPGKRGDKLTIDEVPVQRLYRKTMEGIVEIADSGWHLLIKRKQRAEHRQQMRPVQSVSGRCSSVSTAVSLPFFPVLPCLDIMLQSCPTCADNRRKADISS